MDYSRISIDLFPFCFQKLKKIPKSADKVPRTDGSSFKTFPTQQRDKDKTDRAFPNYLGVAEDVPVVKGDEVAQWLLYQNIDPTDHLFGLHVKYKRKATDANWSFGGRVVSFCQGRASDGLAANLYAVVQFWIGNSSSSKPKDSDIITMNYELDASIMSRSTKEERAGVLRNYLDKVVAQDKWNAKEIVEKDDIEGFANKILSVMGRCFKDIKKTAKAHKREKGIDVFGATRYTTAEVQPNDEVELMEGWLPGADDSTSSSSSSSSGDHDDDSDDDPMPPLLEESDSDDSESEGEDSEDGILADKRRASSKSKKASSSPLKKRARTEDADDLKPYSERVLTEEEKAKRHVKAEYMRSLIRGLPISIPISCLQPTPADLRQRLELSEVYVNELAQRMLKDGSASVFSQPPFLMISPDHAQVCCTRILWFYIYI